MNEAPLVQTVQRLSDCEETGQRRFAIGDGEYCFAEDKYEAYLKLLFTKGKEQLK